MTEQAQTSAPTATETTAPAPALHTHADRLAAAGEALVVDDAPEADGPAGEPATEQPTASAETAPPAPTPSKPAAEAEPEPSAEKRGTAAWQHAQARRKARQAERQFEEAKALQAKVEALQAQLAPFVQLPTMLRTDPLSALDFAAQQAGLESGTKLYERMTHAHLQAADPQAVLAAQLAGVQSELAAMKRGQSEAQQRAQTEAQHRAMQANIAADAAKLAAVLSDEEHFPECRVWAKPVLEAIARNEVEAVYRAGNPQNADIEDVAERIHSHAKAEVEQVGVFQKWWAERQAKLGKATGSTAADTSEVRDGQGTPGAKAPKPAGKSPRSPSNRDNSGTLETRRLSHDERVRLAASRLL